MKNPDLLSLILAALSAVSTIAACIACYLSYKSMKPSIKIFPEKSESKWGKDLAGKYFAAILVEVINNSNVSGSIHSIFLRIRKKKIFAENIYDDEILKTNIEVRNIHTKAHAKVERFKNGTRIDGFIIKTGYFVFPSLPEMEGENVPAVLVYKTSGKIFAKRKKIKLQKSTDYD